MAIDSFGAALAVVLQAIAFVQAVCAGMVLAVYAAGAPLAGRV